MKINIKPKNKIILNYIIQDKSGRTLIKLKVSNNIVIECDHDMWLNQTFDDKLQNLQNSNKYNIVTNENNI